MIGLIPVAWALMFHSPAFKFWAALVAASGGAISP